MPPKGFKRTKQTEKKKIVTSTLLTISLEVENYLYAKETISLQQAKDYIKEISKLKIENSDVRSRQVSEKLTSILKALINEYSNKITDDENSNVCSLNNIVEKKLNGNFEIQLNKDLNIRPEFGEASNTVNSQNDLKESNNVDDRIDINNNKTISIDNMSKNLKKEGIPVKNNNESNINLNKSLIEETSDKKHEPITTKNKTKSDPKCVNYTNSVKGPLSNKKNNVKKKQKNDLTWIENIKFVREVDTEEHFGSNLEQTFWCDLTKPAISSHDFEAE